MPVFSTACPRNCYSTCSFFVHVEDGKIVNIDPNTANKATPEGICLKGLSYVERANSPDRILTPLLKRNGKHHAISWDKALDLISGKLIHYKKKFGPLSIFYLTGSGMAGLTNAIGYNFWKLYGGVTMQYGNLCWPAGLEATRLTLGENKHNFPWLLEKARLIILWGKNPAETNIQETVHINKALEQGARLVVIDPRRTPSSEMAGKLFQVNPGTDAALAMALAGIIIRKKQYDADFVHEHVLGFDAYASSLEKHNISELSEVCGIPLPEIEKLAAEIVEVKPMTIIPGYGMQRFTNGGQTIRAILALQAITGNIGKPGGNFQYANLQSYVFDKIKEPLSYYPDPKNDQPFRRTISMAKLGEDILAQNDPPIKMLWVERGNPVAQNPNTNKVLKAIRSIDFKVVVDQFMTDTAVEADLILPAKNMFEQSDIIGSYWHPYVQLMQKAVEPAGEVKPEPEIYYHLSNRLGFSDKDITRNIPEPGNEPIIKFLKEKFDQIPGLSWEELEKGPVLLDIIEEVPFHDLKFKTPSGKIELVSEQAHELWGVSRLPTYEKTVDNKDNSKEYPLNLLTPNTKNRIHSQFNNLEIIKLFGPVPTVTMHPDDAGDRNIDLGDWVKVFNNRGSFELKAELSFGMKRGCVSISNGWWISQGGSTNFLSEGRETDMGHGAAFHDVMVEVEKI